MKRYKHKSENEGRFSCYYPDGVIFISIKWHIVLIYV